MSQLEHLAVAFACPGDSLHDSMSILALLVVALAVSILVVPVSRWSQAGGKGTNLDRVFGRFSALWALSIFISGLGDFRGLYELQGSLKP